MSQAFPPPQQPAGQNPFGQPAPFQPTPPPARTGNIGVAIAVAVVAAIAAAAAYGGLMRAFADDDGSYTEIGYIAVGVGALIGFAAGKLGGRNPLLPIVSAVLALAAVYAGQIFGMSLIASHVVEQLGGGASSWTDFLGSDNILKTSAFEGWKEDADAMTYLFIAIGGITGFTSAKKIGG
ncbi:hypothetical protein [Streptomyces indicus]|uniref:Uncharacterized protein n=1 Tax=Streptomyces indicus TaxID=417292 RepID=A0A1G9ED26_9ACTN|nr:hypothetical protein [Streptomyces indicus]SDK73994.1 hypothetical protein SAMN05421806_11185 [Streptomyces indicus]